MFDQVLSGFVIQVFKVFHQIYYPILVQSLQLTQIQNHKHIYKVKIVQ